jgi:hypothetical protein
MSALRSSRLTALGLALGWGSLVLAPGACGDSSSANDIGLAGSQGPVPAIDAPAAIGPTTPGANPATPAPERENEATFRAPVVTGKYVWSANPTSGRVAVIAADDYTIHAAEAGKGPTFIAAVSPDAAQPRAIVINTGADNATLLELANSGAISTLSIPLHQGADSWSVSPDGRIAIAWTDSRKVTRPDPTDGFQDITVIELPDGAPPVATRLTLGYRPSAISFDSAGRRAFGVTQDGISVVDLDPGSVRLSQLIPLPSDLRLAPDVSVTADGARALARVEGSSNLYDIDLATGSSTAIDLGGPITDLDLSDDGTLAVAVVQHSTSSVTADAGADPNEDAGAGSDGGTDTDGADAGAPADAGLPPVITPARTTSEALFIPIPAGLTASAERRSFTSSTQTFRSIVLSADGRHSVLFTTATPSSRVTLLGPDLSARALDLIAPVRAVFLTADGASAIALQDPARGSVKRGAFSVLSLDSVRSPKLVASDAPAISVALSPTNSERALVTVSDPGNAAFGAYLVRTPNLQVDYQSLSSEPLASGTVPGVEKAFVAEVHPEGRITFIGLDDGQGREITGFELSSKVVTE